MDQIGVYNFSYNMVNCLSMTAYIKISYQNTFIPSSTITEVSVDEEDSIKITPSEPIFSIALAIKLPMNSSFPDDIEATAVE